MASILAALILLACGPALAQSSEEVIAAIQLELFEEFYEQAGETTRRALVSKGRSNDEARRLAFEIYDNLAYCNASLAQETALKEQVPVEYVLDLLRRNMCSLGDWRQRYGFDTRELHNKSEVCAENYSRDFANAFMTQ